MSVVTTRSQLVDVLLADPALLAMLPGGTSGIINESDFRESINPSEFRGFPLLVIHYLGPHPYPMIPDFNMEAWEFVCFDRANAYINIETILERVRFLLHRKVLEANTDGTSAVGEVMYGHRTRSHFDTVYRTESQSSVFFVAIHRST